MSLMALDSNAVGEKWILQTAVIRASRTVVSAGERLRQEFEFSWRHRRRSVVRGGGTQ